MARLPRFVIPGQPQHIIQRGNNREPVFYDTEDYRFYLDKLSAACQKHDCELHVYVLMTNHIHLLLTPDTESWIGKVMQSLGRYYVQYFNYSYNRQVIGETSFERRYYILSFYRGAQAFSHAIRAHWGIENRLHWILDVTLREDESRFRRGAAPENLF